MEWLPEFLNQRAQLVLDLHRVQIHRHGNAGDDLAPVKATRWAADMSSSLDAKRRPSGAVLRR